MQIAKVTINAEVILTESISDYLIGVLNAAVEYSVDDDQTAHVIHAFIMADSWLDEERQSLEAAVKRFTDEMADIFQVEKPTIGSEIIADQDWSKNWKAYFKPFEILEGLVIAPSWQPYTLGENEKVIVMDPGMAFGTGHHETTSLIMQYIEEMSVDDLDVLDMGCGTAILGMFCSMKGARAITGIDIDEWAFNNALESIKLNNISNMEVLLGGAELLSASSYDLILANINRNILLNDMNSYVNVLKSGGQIIFSGFYLEDLPLIDAEANKYGLTLISQKTDNKWTAAAYSKTVL